MFKFHRSPAIKSLVTSRLFDQNNFYGQLFKDLGSCKTELVIESPFITARRMATLWPVLTKLRKRDVKLVVNTRHPQEHEEKYRLQAEDAVARLQSLGVTVLYTGGHHRKIVIIDRSILWEGSANVLSQNDSCEIMRRITSKALAQQMVDFLQVEQYLVQ